MNNNLFLVRSMSFELLFGLPTNILFKEVFSYVGVRNLFSSLRPCSKATRNLCQQYFQHLLTPEVPWYVYRDLRHAISAGKQQVDSDLIKRIESRLLRESKQRGAEFGMCLGCHEIYWFNHECKCNSYILGDKEASLKSRSKFVPPLAVGRDRAFFPAPPPPPPLLPTIVPPSDLLPAPALPTPLNTIDPIYVSAMTNSPARHYCTRCGRPLKKDSNMLLSVSVRKLDPEALFWCFPCIYIVSEQQIAKRQKTG